MIVLSVHKKREIDQHLEDKCEHLISDMAMNKD